MTLSMIVAVGNNYEIGLNNQLLWHISEDLKHFKALTNGHHIIMGRNTFESIGRPLPNRTSIVLSNSGFEYEGVFTCKGLESAVAVCKDNGEEEAFIIGGAKVYKDTYDKVDRLYLSRVDFDGEADTFFPKIDINDWNIEKEVKYEAKEDGTPAWTYQLLERADK